MSQKFYRRNKKKVNKAMRRYLKEHFGDDWRNAKPFTSNIKRVIQTHHISYEPDVTVKVFRDEHYYLAKLDRYKSQRSLGFLISLVYFALTRFPMSINIDKEQASLPSKGVHTKHIKKGKHRR